MDHSIFFKLGIDQYVSYGYGGLILSVLAVSLFPQWRYDELLVTPAAADHIRDVTLS